MTRNNESRLHVVGYAMMKDLWKKRTTVEATDESASASSGDRLREEGSKRREDLACSHRT